MPEIVQDERLGPVPRRAAVTAIEEAKDVRATGAQYIGSYTA